MHTEFLSATLGIILVFSLAATILSEVIAAAQPCRQKGDWPCNANRCSVCRNSPPRTGSSFFSLNLTRRFPLGANLIGMDNHPILDPQQSRILRILRSKGPLSRWQLHEHTALRPNTVGTHVAGLLSQGLLQEQPAEASGPGRPRVPLAIDTETLHVVGAAIRPGRVEACRLNLLGHVLGQLHTQPVDEPSQTVSVLQESLRQLINNQTFLVGLSTTGFVDTSARRIVLSSALPGQQVTSLAPLFDVIGDRPLVVENDMHALAAHWLQQHYRQLHEDVVLVYLDDGQLGSALLVRGEPNWGCLVGGNELGHTRLPVETELCYCGNTGCLERICSTEFLRREAPGSASLLDHVAAFDGTQPPMKRMIDLLSTGLANTVNYLRPHRVVLVSPFTRHDRFIESLVQAVRTRLLNALCDRVDFHFWDQDTGPTGETSGWLALAAIYYPNWTKAILPQ